ncbi:hypothetical protein [Paraliomyxa miuraensis]|uniref:hypothetical protein n=1 Tax=Paraliomyxa miuraensis TaxID=376150 RepID=UPI00224F8E8D|nr:hypothetical protein [Paraliomyxa miuraensis]MCX4244855.1 hypothetical protein [Paraliomyxa miuraensis]
MLGSTALGVHSIGRALGRAIDATVVDGDRLRFRVGDDADPRLGISHDWLDALRLQLPESRTRPHVVTTCTVLTQPERDAIRRQGMCLVYLCGREAGEDEEPEEPDVRVEIDGCSQVEGIAARVLAGLVPRLESTTSSASRDGGVPVRGDSVCSGPRD